MPQLDGLPAKFSIGFVRGAGMNDVTRAVEREGFKAARDPSVSGTPGAD